MDILPSFSPTETKIIEAYLALSFRIGVTQLTLQKVAAEANVAFGTVRYHFADKTKLDLAQAASIYVAVSGQRFIEDYLYKAQGSPGYNGLKVYIYGTFEWIQKCPNQSHFMLHYYYLNGIRSPLPLPNQALLKKARMRMLSLFHEGVGQGIYSRAPHAEEAIHLIHTLMVGSIVVASTEGESSSFKRHRDLLLAKVEAILKMK